MLSTGSSDAVVYSTLWCAVIQPGRFIYIPFTTPNKGFVAKTNWC